MGRLTEALTKFRRLRRAQRMSLDVLLREAIAADDLGMVLAVRICNQEFGAFLDRQFPKENAPVGRAVLAEEG